MRLCEFVSFVRSLTGLHCGTFERGERTSVSMCRPSRRADDPLAITSSESRWLYAELLQRRKILRDIRASVKSERFAFPCERTIATRRVDPIAAAAR